MTTMDIDAASSAPEALALTGALIELDATKVVNYAMQQNDVPVVRSIRLTNQTDQPLRDLRVIVSITGGLLEPLEIRLAELAAGGCHRFAPIDFSLPPERLANQLERELVELRVDVFTGDVPVGQLRQGLEILAFNEWPGTSLLPEILTAFITPNHPRIERFLAKMRDAIGAATEDPSLSGYQTGRPERVRAIVRAAASVFRGCDIGYVNPPASYELSGQKIRSTGLLLRRVDSLYCGLLPDSAR